MQTLLIVLLTNIAAFTLGKWYGSATGYLKRYRQGWQDCMAFHNYESTIQQAADKLKEWNFKKHRTN